MNEQKKPGVRVPPDVVLPLFLPREEKGKSGGDDHDKRTLDQRVENRVNHFSRRTHDLGGGLYEGKLGAD